MDVIFQHLNDIFVPLRNEINCNNMYDVILHKVLSGQLWSNWFTHLRINFQLALLFHMTIVQFVHTILTRCTKVVGGVYYISCWNTPKLLIFHHRGIWNSAYSKFLRKPAYNNCGSHRYIENVYYSYRFLPLFLLYIIECSFAVESFGELKFVFSISNLSARGVPTFGINIAVWELVELNQSKTE